MKLKEFVQFCLQSCWQVCRKIVDDGYVVPVVFILLYLRKQLTEWISTVYDAAAPDKRL